MCEETKRSFANQTTEDTIEVGAMFDLALEQLEDLTAVLYLNAKATIAAALIIEGGGAGDHEGVAWIGQRTEQVMAELTEPREPEGEL